jgi:hypothetical protein
MEAIDKSQFIIIGKYYISKSIMMSFPIKLYVTNSETNECKLLYDYKVFQLLRSEGLDQKPLEDYFDEINITSKKDRDNYFRQYNEQEEINKMIENSEEKIENEIDLNKLSPSLIKYFEPESNINKNIQTDWEPPKYHGLNNSFIIIPEYYQKTGEKILKIDYYNMILDDIRNLRKLNKYQLEFIKNLDDDSKQKIFTEFNNLFDVINSLLT